MKKEIFFLALLLTPVFANVVDDCVSMFDVRYDGDYIIYKLTNPKYLASKIPEIYGYDANGNFVSGSVFKNKGVEFRFSKSSLKEDVDKDGINDAIEGLCSNVRINDVAILLLGSKDTDVDGLTDGEELKLGTYPFAKDTDNDGIDDYFEVHGRPFNLDENIYGFEYYIKTYNIKMARTDPKKVDTDNDGISDGDEIKYAIYFIERNTYLIDKDPEIKEKAERSPITKDSDNDGLEDSDEIFIVCSDSDWKTLAGNYYLPTELRMKGYDLASVTSDYCLINGCYTIITAYTDDTDTDGLTDKEEVSYNTSIVNPDTDADGLTDKEEIDLGTNPLNKDTDQDGLDDYLEIQIKTDPRNNDTDQDKISDFYEYYGRKVVFYTSGTNYEFSNKKLNIVTKAYSSYAILKTDPTRADSDGDGISDFKDPFVHKEQDTDGDGLNDVEDPCPNAYDCDFDGLNDKQEKELGTNPLQADSDCDGLIDGFEARLGKGSIKGPLNLLSADSDNDGISDEIEAVCGCYNIYNCDPPVDANKKIKNCNKINEFNVFLDNKKINIEKCKKEEKKEEDFYISSKIVLKSLTDGVKVDAGKIIGTSNKDIELSYEDSYYVIWQGNKKTKCALYSIEVNGFNAEVDEDKKTITIPMKEEGLLGDLFIRMKFKCNSSIITYDDVSDTFFVLVDAKTKPKIFLKPMYWDDNLNVGLVSLRCMDCKKIEAVSAGAYVNGQKKFIRSFPSARYYSRILRIIPIKREYNKLEVGTIYSKYEDKVEVLKTGKDIGLLAAKAEMAKSTLSKIAYGLVATSKGIRTILGGIDVFIPSEEDTDTDTDVEKTKDFKKNLVEKVKETMIEKGVELIENSIEKAADIYEEKISKKERDFKVIVKACNDFGCTTNSTLIHGFEYD